MLDYKKTIPKLYLPKLIKYLKFNKLLAQYITSLTALLYKLPLYLYHFLT